MNKEELFRELELYGIDENVLEAMRRVPREKFVPEAMVKYAYENVPLAIGWNQTISQPLMIAIMTQELDLKEGEKVLEVGAGSGYQAAVIKELVGKGKVITIERIEGLAEFAKENLKKAGYDVKVVVGDGSLGYEEEKPYDKIIVTAGAPRVPEPLVKQLKMGGKLVIPVGGWWAQELLVLKKKRGGNEIERKGGCIFVKLVGREAWPE